MPVYLEKKDEATVVSEEFPDATYIVIPNALMIRSDLTLAEKLLLALLFGFSHNGLKIICSNGYLARRLALSLDKIRKGLQSLEEKSFIHRKIYNRNIREITVFEDKIIKQQEGAVSETRGDDVMDSRDPAAKSITYIKEDTLSYNKVYKKEGRNFFKINRNRNEEAVFEAKRKVALAKAETVRE